MCGELFNENETERVIKKLCARQNTTLLSYGVNAGTLRSEGGKIPYVYDGSSEAMRALIKNTAKEVRS